MVIILDKHILWSYNFICRAYSRLYCSLKLDLKLKSLISTQNIFHTSEFSGQSGSKIVNFGLMLNCFGPVRSGENIIGSVRGRGHKIYYFSVRSESGKKITGQYGFGVPKTLPSRTLISISCFWLRCTLLPQRYTSVCSVINNCNAGVELEKGHQGNCLYGNYLYALCLCLGFLQFQSILSHMVFSHALVHWPGNEYP